MSNISNNISQMTSNIPNNISQIEIRSGFEQFKVGLTNRITNNYQDTNERKLVIDLIPNVSFEQATKRNAFCQDILPILWDASQDEKDYCHNSQTIFARISGGFNKELRVRSYFYGSGAGNVIKGSFLQSEIDKITSNNDNIVDVVKECAQREVFEETNIKIEFIDDLVCSLNIYNIIITGHYKIRTGKHIYKHNVNIHLTSSNYKLLQKCFYDNLEEHKIFMENTGEISALIV